MAISLASIRNELFPGLAGKREAEVRYLGLAVLKTEGEPFDVDPYGALQRAFALTREATRDNLFKQEFGAPAAVVQVVVPADPAPTSVAWPPRTELIID